MDGIDIVNIRGFHQLEFSVSYTASSKSTAAVVTCSVIYNPHKRWLNWQDILLGGVLLHDFNKYVTVIIIIFFLKQAFSMFTLFQDTFVSIILTQTPSLSSTWRQNSKQLFFHGVYELKVYKTICCF